MKQLILNADDYGMNEAISRGILAAAHLGLVRSTSAMTNCTDFDRAMDEIEASCPDIDVGMHLNLTWDRPLSDPRRIPTLVDVDGRFLSRRRLLVRALAGAIREKEVYDELKLQVGKLAARRHAITHIDGHHHVHVYPVVRDAVEILAREFDMPYVRAPREGLWSPWHWEPVRRLGMSMMSASRACYWRVRGFKTADYFGGFALGGDDEIRARWMRTLGSLPDGVGEIMVHPGRSSGDNDRYNAGREAELELFTDEGFAGQARGLGIRFTSFRDISFT